MKRTQKSYQITKWKLNTRENKIIFKSERRLMNVIERFASNILHEQKFMYSGGDFYICAAKCLH